MPSTIPAAVMESRRAPRGGRGRRRRRPARHLRRAGRSRHRGDPGDDRRRRVERRSGGDLGAERPRLDRRRARRAVRRRGDRADQHPLEGRRGGVRPRRPPSVTLLCTTVGFLDTDTVAMLDDDPTELPAPALDRPAPGSARAEGRASAPEHRCTTVDRAGASSSRPATSVTEDAAWERLRSVQPTDTSDTLFTSGTTGRPKGVVMTHAQTVAQFTDWCDFAGLQPDDRYLIVNPFFHMFGYKAGLARQPAARGDDLPGRRVRRADRARHSCRPSGSRCCPAHRRSTGRSSTTPAATTST